MKVKIVTQIEKKQLKADGSVTVQSIVIFKMFSSVLDACMAAFLQILLQISTLVGCYSNGTLLKWKREKKC